MVSTLFSLAEMMYCCAKCVPACNLLGLVLQLYPARYLRFANYLADFAVEDYNCDILECQDLESNEYIDGLFGWSWYLAYDHLSAAKLKL